MDGFTDVLTDKQACRLPKIAYPFPVERVNEIKGSLEAFSKESVA